MFKPCVAIPRIKKFNFTRYEIERLDKKLNKLHQNYKDLTKHNPIPIILIFNTNLPLLQIRPIVKIELTKRKRKIYRFGERTSPTQKSVEA